MDFEKNLAQLENIVKTMEKGEASLDESLKLFEEGVKLSRQCQEQLAQTEAKVKKLLSVDASGKAIVQDFDTDAE